MTPSSPGIDGPAAAIVAPPARNARAATMMRRKVAGRVRIGCRPFPVAEPRPFRRRTVASGYGVRHRGKYLSSTQSAELGTGAWRWPRVLRLIHADLPAARERELDEAAPPLFMDRPGTDLPRAHRSYERIHIVDKEVQLVTAVCLGRV